MTQSSSDIDFSMSLIWGPTRRDCGSGGTNARRLLGPLDIERRQQEILEERTLDWFEHQSVSSPLWRHQYKRCHPRSVTVSEALADKS
jgi:hypothetical protein